MSCLFVAVACGGSADRDNEEPAGEGELHPPPNVDVETCASIVSAEGDVNDGCSSCCSDNGFTGAVYYGGCVCGHTLDTAGETVCMDQTASGDACTACCESSGYFNYSYLGGDSTALCQCSGKNDPGVCAASLQGSDPPNDCPLCCLNNGYLGSAYTGFGTQECLCIDL